MITWCNISRSPAMLYSPCRILAWSRVHETGVETQRVQPDDNPSEYRGGLPRQIEENVPTHSTILENIGNVARTASNSRATDASSECRDIALSRAPAHQFLRWMIARHSFRQLQYSFAYEILSQSAKRDDKRGAFATRHWLRDSRERNVTAAHGHVTSIAPSQDNCIWRI